MEGCYTAYDKLKAHIKGCGWCLEAGGEDAPPRKLCEQGRFLERRFDSLRDVRAPFEPRS